MGLALRGLRHNCQSLQTEISGSSLSSLSKEIVLQNLVKDVLENECRSVWNDEMMKHKKSILNGICQPPSSKSSTENCSALTQTDPVNR